MSKTTTREIGGRTFELVETNRGYLGRYDKQVDIFETTGGGRIHLTERIDPAPEAALTDGVLLALASPRRQALAEVMRDSGIMAGPDYRYEEDYELLFSSEPVGRYVAVSGDETYHWIHVVDTIEQALKSFEGDIADQFGNEFPHHPKELIDLDTGESIGFRIQVRVELDH